MKIDFSYFQHLNEGMATKRILPLEVYISCIGKRRFMVPATNLPHNHPFYPIPCEIKAIKFPLNIKIKHKKLPKGYSLEIGYKFKGKESK